MEDKKLKSEREWKFEEKATSRFHEAPKEFTVKTLRTRTSQQQMQKYLLEQHKWDERTFNPSTKLT
jgi:hypothetical protein